MAPKVAKEKAPVKKAAVGGTKKISAYMAFCKVTRPIIVAEDPELGFGAIGKEMGKRWKALSDSEKEGYKK